MDLTLDEVKGYLAIDFEDEVTDRLLSRLMGTADGYLRGAVGDEYPKHDERAKQIALLLIAELYDNREMNEKASINVRKIVDDFALQLRMELRRGIHDKADQDSETQSG